MFSHLGMILCFLLRLRKYMSLLRLASFSSCCEVSKDSSGLQAECDSMVCSCCKKSQ